MTEMSVILRFHLERAGVEVEPIEKFFNPGAVWDALGAGARHQRVKSGAPRGPESRKRRVERDFVKFRMALAKIKPGSAPTAACELARKKARVKTGWQTLYNLTRERHPDALKEFEKLKKFEK